MTTSFPRWRGDGQGAFIWEAARAITQEGVQVRVVAMHSPGTRTCENWDGVEIIRPRYWWPEQWEILRKEGGGLPASLQKHPVGIFQVGFLALALLLPLIRTAQEYDLLHAHWTFSAGIGILGHKFHQKPVIATIHGSDIFRLGRLPFGNWFNRTILERCHQVIAVSQALRQAAAALGVDASKIRVISNGVDTSVFTPTESKQRERILLFVGSFIPRKGVKYLLKAFQGLVNDYPDYKLVLVGNGPQLSDMEELANALGISEKVLFTGDQPSTVVAEWMRRARVFVLPSLEEAQGVVLLEAMASGTPIVASNVGGIPEVITEQVGILVPPGDSDALLEAMRIVLMDPELWHHMSEQARRRAMKHYDWKFIGKQIVGIYHEVTENSL